MEKNKEEVKETAGNSEEKKKNKEPSFDENSVDNKTEEETKEGGNENKEGKSVIENEKLISILAYFAVGIVWYFVDEKLRKSSLIKFHVKQALGIVILQIAVSVVASMFYFLMGPFQILHFALFVLWIFGLISAIQEKKNEVPVIGKFSAKYLKF